MVRFSRGDRSSIPGLNISSKQPFTNSIFSDRYKTSK